MLIERNSPLQRGGSDEVGDGVCKTKSNAFHYDLTLTTIEERTRAVPPSPQPVLSEAEGTGEGNFGSI
jgi:hypothetical protein